MINKRNIRTSLNPLLILTFIIVGLTGSLMLFHIHTREIKHLHEWMSVVFLILCIVHLVLNWKACLAYLKNGPVAMAFIGICLLSALLLLSTDGKDDDSRYGLSAPGHYRHLK